MSGDKTATSRETALIFEIKGNSLDDGPGIRTVLFFKGCPLNCLWCHNPESKDAKVEISFDKDKCIGCDSCLDACDEKSLDRNTPFFVDRHRCALCMKCKNACPSGALTEVGRYWSIDEVMKELEKDLLFFQASGGGITLSGGEPTLFMDFSSVILRKAKELGINTLLETCGLFHYENFLSLIYPHLDIIYYDIKLFDPLLHKKFCGVTNGPILKNFESLSRKCSEDGIELLPRIPLIPGITADSDNLGAIALFLKKLGVKRVELLSYNPLWVSKLGTLGHNDPFPKSSPMKEWMPVSLLARCKEIFSGFDVR